MHPPDNGTGKILVGAAGVGCRSCLFTGGVAGREAAMAMVHNDGNGGRRYIEQWQYLSRYLAREITFIEDQKRIN